MESNKPNGGNGAEDDTYVLEDTGETLEDIEAELELSERQSSAAEAVADEAQEAEVAGAPSDAAPETLVRENQELRDKVLRTLADYENFRKRSEREKADFYRYALAGTLRELLPVLDNFERALSHAGEEDDFHKGVVLIYKQLSDALQKHGLRVIEEVGVPFDPNFHEAVVRDENPSVPSHTVVEILQKGYFLHDRLLRPAMVKVSVGGPEYHEETPS
ncbi:MAG TPA: nucleotide exchange factor GrpE [Thermoanaerobaculia bacterium]|nr:nucleotide exchange factor GrpE [Thermoanaerobaculia bacterium]